MSKFRENRTYQVTRGNQTWLGSALLIIGCAIAAAVGTALFSPAPIDVAPNQFASQPANGRTVITQTLRPVNASGDSGVTKKATPPAQMTFQYRPTSKLEAAMDFDFRFIYANGYITQGTAVRFANFLKVHSISPGAIVIFNSPGGSVSEAIDLGTIIREAGLSTSVKEVRLDKSGKIIGPINGCFSSCTLAFLGGVERTVPDDALFGVHQVSLDTAISPTEALELGQVAMGAIAEYASAMGVKAQFVTELTRATPDGINLLSASKLAELDVTTPDFQTSWQIESFNGQFYLLATTQTHGGSDKIGVNCAQSGPEMVFMFNTSGQFMQDTLNYTSDYGFEFDQTHMDLQPSEVLQPVRKLNDEYVEATIALSPRILDQLRSANDLTFEMMMPSHTTYAGWTTDFASGRAQFFSFLQSCEVANPQSDTDGGINLPN